MGQLLVQQAVFNAKIKLRDLAYIKQQAKALADMCAERV